MHKLMTAVLTTVLSAALLLPAQGSALADAAADDPDDRTDRGPVRTAPDVTSLLQDLTGSDVLTSRTTAEGSDGKTYCVQEFVDLPGGAARALRTHGRQPVSDLGDGTYRVDPTGVVLTAKAAARPRAAALA